MRRAAASAAGFVFGVLLTWLCLYVFSNAAWRRTEGVPVGGCLDSGVCTWWALPMFLGYLFLLPILFGVLNGVAWRRWPVRKWGRWFLTLVILTIGMHLASYL